MVILMVPGFFMVLIGGAAIPTFGDAAGAVMATGIMVMLFGAACPD